MATQQFKLHDLLGRAGETSAWTQGKFTCAACRRRRDSARFETEIGSVCPACVEKHLKKRSRSEDLLFWEVGRMVKALAEDGPLDDRLIVLWKFHDALRYTNAKGPSKLAALYENLVKNLGYIQEHPLAQAVRQAAYEACVTVGKPLVPTLLKLCQPIPWQFYANIVMVLGTVAPEHGEVQALLQKATRDSNPEIRSRAISVLQQHVPAKFGRKQDALEAVLKSLPQDLRDLVHIGMQPTQQSAASISPKASQPSEYLPGQKQIEELLASKYSADALKKIYSTHMQNLIEPELHPDAGLPPQHLKKHALAWLIARVYTDHTLFDQFYARLPHDVKEILNMLVWEGGEANVEFLEKTYQVEMVKPSDSFRYGGSVSQDVHAAYSIFWVRREYRHGYYYRDRGNRYEYHFLLPDQMRTLFKTYLPHPPEYELRPLAAIDQTEFQYIDNDHILQQLPLFYSYIEQGHLNFSKNTRKVLKTSIKQMAKYCHIREFYENGVKELDYMRTRLLIEFCQGLTIQQPLESTPQSLRSVFQKFFASTGYLSSFSLSSLLWHLQGVHHLDFYNETPEKTVRDTLHALLKSMPVQQWLAVEHLVQYCLYRDMSLEVISKSEAHRYLSYKRDVRRDDYSADNKASVSAGIYKEALLLPFFKAAMFLMAAFGIVDIAYNFPKNDTLQQTGKPYLSEFDGLRYVRLTPLGAYVVGQTQTYEAHIVPEEATIRLDEKRLFITVEGRDRLKTLVVDKIAEKISESCYRVNYQSFLRECASTQDIENTIQLFHTHISANPPQLWKTFLQDVLAKINPLMPKPDLAVYALPENTELRNLVARDEILKKYLLKAEDFHIVIEKRHLSKVKKRLEEFGYLIDNL